MPSGRTKSSDHERYVRVRTLGRGSFGEVFEAQDTLLDRQVAIKTIPFGHLIPLLSRRALLGEARMAAAAGRSAVQVHDLVEVTGGTWLVMEYVPGGSLRDWASPDRSPPVLGTMVDVLVGRLAMLHDLGLVHGDIHPGNVLVRADDDVALADFGLARMAVEVSSKHRAHERHWSAPEVLGTGQATPASDVYSLARVVDWMYTLAGLEPPTANAHGLAERAADRPQDGQSYQRLLDDRDVRPTGTVSDDGPQEADFRAAAAAAREGKTQAAAAILERAIRREPIDPRPRRRLALVRWTGGQRQAAIWELESALRLDPGDRLTATMLRNWRHALEEA